MGGGGFLRWRMGYGRGGEGNGRGGVGVRGRRDGMDGQGELRWISGEGEKAFFSCICHISSRTLETTGDLDV